MRVDPPTVDAVGPIGPTRGTKSQVIGSPPLRLHVDAVFVGGLEIKTNDVTVLGYVGASLRDVAARVGSGRRIRQWKVTQQRLTALINSTRGNNIARELQARSWIKNGWRCAARIF